MKQEFKGFFRIFSFTFCQHVKSKGYRMSGIGIGLLCLLLPMGIMIFLGRPQGADETGTAIESSAESADGEMELTDGNGIINYIYVVDQTAADSETMQQIEDCYAVLNTVGDSRFSALTYEAFADVESAAAASAGSSDTLLLVAEQGTYGLELHVLLPEASGLSEEDAYSYEIFLNSYYSMVQVEKAGLDKSLLAELSLPVTSEIVPGEAWSVSGMEGDDSTEEVAGGESGSEQQDESMEMIKEVLSMLLPYAMIMILYFMILAYGQGVANSVIMEKNSKLMDMFLVAVKPGAMILGKVLAIACSGLLQLFLWMICLAGSFAAGTAIVKSMDPETDMLVIRLFESFGQLSSGLFSVTGIAFTVLILIGGFLLYCSLAAIGGAMASKPEDLSTTNILFTMALVISFFCALSGGALEGTIASTNWMLYMPFTAILVAPGMALLGEMSVIQCLISLGLILLTALVVIWVAGRIYKMLIFHKGNPLSVQNVLKMVMKR